MCLARIDVPLMYQNVIHAHVHVRLYKSINHNMASLTHVLTTVHAYAYNTHMHAILTCV